MARSSRVAFSVTCTVNRVYPTVGLALKDHGRDQTLKGHAGNSGCGLGW